MKEAPALQTESRAGVIFAWRRKGGDWAIRLNDRVPCCWPKAGEGNAARLASAVLVANDKLGTDFTEDEARAVGQRSPSGCARACGTSLRSTRARPADTRPSRASAPAGARVMFRL